ncbi:MAG: glycosyltransferase family A protein [Candidatus Krumholzibacteriia bacterium]
MKAQPLVSVVVPTYGHAALVEETLASIFAQEYPAVEVIVVDDGSPDDTAERLAPLAERGRIRLLRQENRGQAAARNRGLSEARGELVAFLDDDDLWPPDKLSWQVPLLDDPTVAMVYGDYVKLMPDGSERSLGHARKPQGRVHRQFRRRNWLLSPGQALMRTAAVRRCGSFDETIWGSDDWDLYIRLATVGEFRWEPRTALRYRVHAGAASRDALRHVRNHLSVVRRHIGWNLPLLIQHQRLAAGYFVPNLQRYARERRQAGDEANARRAELYALAFRPELLAKSGYLRSLAAEIRRLRVRSATTPGA